MAILKLDGTVITEGLESSCAITVFKNGECNIHLPNFTATKLFMQDKEAFLGLWKMWGAELYNDLQIAIKE